MRRSVKLRVGLGGGNGKANNDESASCIKQDPHTTDNDNISTYPVKTPSYGWFSGRASPAPGSTSQAAFAGEETELKSQVEKLRNEVSTLKASQSIETFKLIKSHQEKYEKVRKDVDAIQYKLDNLKDKADPQVSLMGHVMNTVSWLFFAFDFVIKWGWRFFVIAIVFRWWSSIRSWPSLPWQGW